MEDVRQQGFPWAAPGEGRAPREVVLDAETTARAIALLAGAMRAVVGAVEETPDDR